MRGRSTRYNNASLPSCIISCIGDNIEGPLGSLDVRQATPLLPTKLPLGLKQAPKYSTHILTMANIARFVLNLMAGRPATLTRQPTIPAHADNPGPGTGGHESTHIVHVGLIDSTPIDHTDVEPGDAWDDTQYDPFDSPVTTVDFAAGQVCVPNQTGQEDAPTVGPRFPHLGVARGRAG
jgi:hypothetical protein